MRQPLHTKNRFLLFCGVIASPLLVLIFTIEGIFRADYSSLKYPISSLSIGESGWIQIANFILTGLLLLAFAYGIRSKLVGLVAIGLIGAGLFSTDPLYGYPQDLPLRISQYTLHGHLHDVCYVLIFICLSSACFIFRKEFISEERIQWANYSSATGFSIIAVFILAAMGFKQFPVLVDYAGGLQRLFILIAGTWMSLLALHFLRTSPRP